MTPTRERTLTTVTQEKHLLFLSFDLFCRFFWTFFLFFLLYSVIVVDFIGSRNLIKLLRFYFSSVTFFIVSINLFLYVGPLHFCGVFLFFLSSAFFFSFLFFYSFNFLNLLCYFFIYFFVCFSYCSFPLQLIFI